MDGPLCSHRSCRIALAHREAQFLRRVEGITAQRQRVVMRAMADLARQCRQRTLALAIDRWHFVVTRGNLQRLGLVRVVWERWYRETLLGRGKRVGRRKAARVLGAAVTRLCRDRLSGAMHYWYRMARSTHFSVQTDPAIRGDVDTQTPAVILASASCQTLPLFHAQVGCQTHRVVTVRREVQTRPQLRPSRMTQTRLHSRVAGTQTAVRRLVSAGVITDRVTCLEEGSQTRTVDTVDGEAQVELEVSESSVQTKAAGAAVAVASQTDDNMAVLAGSVEMGRTRDRRVEIALDVGVQTELPCENDSLHVRSSPILVAKGVQVVDAERPGVGSPPRRALRHAEGQTEAWPVALEGVTVGVQTDSRATVEAATVHDERALPDSAGPIDRGVQTELLRDVSPTWSTRVTAATQTDEAVKGTETVSVGSIEWDDVLPPPARGSIAVSAEVQRKAPVPLAWREGSPLEAAANEEATKAAPGQSLPARYRGPPQREGSGSDVSRDSVAMAEGTAIQTSPCKVANTSTQTKVVSWRSVGTETERPLPSRRHWLLAIRCLVSLVEARLRYGYGLLVSNRMVWDNKELAGLVVSLQGRIDTTAAALRDREVEVSQLKLGIAAQTEAEAQTAAEVAALTAKCGALEERCASVAALEGQYGELEARCEALFNDNVELAGSLEKALEGVHKAEAAERRIEELQIMLADKRDKAREEMGSPSNEESLDDSTTVGIQEQLDAYMELLVDLTSKLDRSEEEKKVKEEELGALKGRYELLLAGRSSTGG
ncbi:hypothetical protein FOZ63_008004 [Perkinsus olseni]|uniref:Uncharacterized protein n=1 Tax=Perkinsus olseni TaxID=32597 RepID=A0A7J6SCQ3_PEROL|nr:hypothetical protein FOZ63_008004 [Perkinsus olseni]